MIVLKASGREGTSKVRVSVLLAILALGIMLAPVGVLAQSEADIAELEIAIWPEFDREAMLVIYRLRLSPELTLPANIRVPIPAEAGEPHAVAWQDEAGRLLLARYESEARGEWLIINLTAESRLAQVEFYSDYDLVGTERRFQLVWPSGFPLEKLRYEVQEPSGAMRLLVDPEPDEASIGSYGLNYLRADLGAVPSDVSILIEVSYAKADASLTADALVTPAPAATNRPISAEGGTPDVGELLPWLLFGFGAVLVLMGAFFYLRLNRQPQIAVKRRKSRMAGSQPEPEVGIDASTIFCHQCGTQASINDNFCRHCGEQLRR